MYLFAHLFSGVFIGIVFFPLWKDRRVIPVCIAGALFSDILDKPLSLLMPDIFGSTRTIGHTLILVLVLMIAALILWYRYGNILGMVFAGIGPCPPASGHDVDPPRDMVLPAPGHVPDSTGSGWFCAVPLD